jgi:RNA processing factor Prp31
MSASSVPAVKTPKDKYLDAITKLLGIIDDIAPNINDGQYLNLCNELKELYDFDFSELIKVRNIIVNNDYYRRHIRASVQRKSPLTDAQKLAHKDYMVCDCGRIIKKDYYDNHIETQTHKRIIENDEVLSNCLPQNDRTIIKLKVNKRPLELQRKYRLEAFIIKHITKVQELMEQPEIEN